MSAREAAHYATTYGGVDGRDWWRLRLIKAEPLDPRSLGRMLFWHAHHPRLQRRPLRLRASTCSAVGSSRSRRRRRQQQPLARPKRRGVRREASQTNFHRHDHGGRRRTREPQQPAASSALPACLHAPTRQQTARASSRAVLLSSLFLSPRAFPRAREPAHGSVPASASGLTGTGRPAAASTGTGCPAEPAQGANPRLNAKALGAKAAVAPPTDTA